MSTHLYNCLYFYSLRSCLKSLLTFLSIWKYLSFFLNNKRWMFTSLFISTLLYKKALVLPTWHTLSYVCSSFGPTFHTKKFCKYTNIAFLSVSSSLCSYFWLEKEQNKILYMISRHVFPFGITPFDAGSNTCLSNLYISVLFIENMIYF